MPGGTLMPGMSSPSNTGMPFAYGFILNMLIDITNP